MKINTISSTINSFSNKSVQNPQKTKAPSFKSIYVEDVVDLGNVSEEHDSSTFLKRDALLLNKIASLYPNQDCFIRRGYGGRPRLEYREKPPEVQVFSANMFNQYNMKADPINRDYPCVPLILDDSSDLNRIIGLNSYISLNPSLAYTIKVGFELHKKLIEKKYEIMEAIGKTDRVSIGEETITEKARAAISSYEEAVKRHLLESAYLALSKRASAQQIYASNYPKVQSIMEADRMFDMTTSVAEQNRLSKGSPIEDIDICDFAIRKYPDDTDNIKKNNQLRNYMIENNLVLD